MSDSNQGGQAPYDPYGQNPYGQNPAAPSGETPYGSAPPANPYGQPPAQAPVNPVPATNPYGAAPYGQQPMAPPVSYGGPLGDGLDMYGRPLGSDARPGTVTAAGWITLVVSGLTFLLFLFLTFALFVARDEFTSEVDKAIRDSGSSTTDFSAEDAFGVVVAVMLVFVLWNLIACVLAVFTMRRSNASRILLVISAVVAGLLSLLAIGSVVSAIPLLACGAVVVLLFTGGAGDWFAGRRRY